jgi:hypothetical protein
MLFEHALALKQDTAVDIAEVHNDMSWGPWKLIISSQRQQVGPMMKITCGLPVGCAMAIREPRHICSTRKQVVAFDCSTPVVNAGRGIACGATMEGEFLDVLPVDGRRLWLCSSTT